MFKAQTQQTKVGEQQIDKHTFILHPLSYLHVSESMLITFYALLKNVPCVSFHCKIYFCCMFRDRDLTASSPLPYQAVLLNKQL